MKNIINILGKACALGFILFAILGLLAVLLQLPIATIDYLAVGMLYAFLGIVGWVLLSYLYNFVKQVYQ